VYKYNKADNISPSPAGPALSGHTRVINEESRTPMAYLLNNATTFAADAAEGLALAYPGHIRAVRGGVVRRSEPIGQTVAVVIGGGSGHYPAFGGLVGDGLADGAALGNLFASPSASQIVSIAREVNSGAGVLFAFGNYAGDMLNFRQAQQTLGREGIDARIVAVTDDISSAGTTQTDLRRGIAGGLAVYKVAAAAAAEGHDLDEVERLANLANARTRTLGVAFSGCTLPGASAPLFVVPAGRMAVGMGIHGEPGISELDIPSADGLAALLVESLFAERPDGANRVVLLVNGLGSFKYEELFVVYRAIAAVLDGADVHIVDAEVGEFVTSFEMAGMSLTTIWVDDELEPLWSAPVDAPAFRRGALATRVREQSLAAPTGSLATTEYAQSSLESKERARELPVLLDRVRAVIESEADELGRLDAIAGDGDHGIGMLRGVRAAALAAHGAVDAGAGFGSTLVAAGAAWSADAGGTSGVLWGMALTELGLASGDESAPSAATVSDGITRAAQAIGDFGKARIGDKTMLDALIPFAQSVAESVKSDQPLAESWATAAVVAREAASATAELLPRIGRARPHAENSLGTPDPGAISFALIVETVGHSLALDIINTEREASK
jgi:D-erythrulose 4-kinase